ncbi:MAG: glutamate--tRNA ligase, partial [Peptococcaceae bacterium]|nr:glutamate--tRNA ligase [Peptococcaceae bacterium]
MEKFRVRFAPSPTGPLHIGGARSALFNYLLARKNGGDFVVRIEDTDRERSSKASEENIFASLKWLGLDIDETVGMDTPYGPYRQMERLDIYQKYAQQLLDEGKAYYCYCTPEEIEAEREAAMAKGEMPIYSGKCRHLTEEERAQKIAEGRKPVVRFNVPLGNKLMIDDAVRGMVQFESDGVGDFVIVKSDGIPTYNFAVVIDDHFMEISHVIRAEEHLSNTPRQAVLYQAFGWEMPQFAHISLILGEDRKKMSKRHGATSVTQYEELGYLPEAVFNFLALLGWSPGGEEEIMSKEEIIEKFSLDGVAKNPAVFDMEKLKWLNGNYIRQSSVERIVDLAIPYLQREGYLSETVSEENRHWVTLIV